VRLGDARVNVLVADVGGTHVKLLATGRRTQVKFDSGPHLTPAVMARETLAATAGWRYDAVTIGYPGPVRKGRPIAEPHNLGSGWIRFGFSRAFGRPVRIVNDAAMQALGSYDGGRMLFLGLGTWSRTTWCSRSSWRTFRTARAGRSRTISARAGSSASGMASGRSTCTS
jgi:predicted NBD/HSP70 family sugar kinase